MIDAKNKVTLAIAAYQKDIQDHVAGYNMMCYMKQGYAVIIPGYDATQDFADWYPRNMDYVMLRLAHAGKIQYNDNNDNKED
jgi:hypothetical protein